LRAAETSCYNSLMSKSTLASVDARAALRGLSKVGEATAYGTARGLNDVAFQAMRFERGNMQKRLDRPSRFTISGTQVERATKHQAVPEASVFIEDKRAKYLAAQEEGGTETRGTIGASRGSGSNAIVIPVAREMENALGSAGRNAVRRALRLPRTFLMRMKNQRFGGVFQRVGPKRMPIKALLIFSEEAQFEPDLHFVDDVSDFARPRVSGAVLKHLERSLRRAVRS